MTRIARDHSLSFHVVNRGPGPNASYSDEYRDLPFGKHREDSGNKLAEDNDKRHFGHMFSLR